MLVRSIATLALLAVSAVAQEAAPSKPPAGETPNAPAKAETGKVDAVKAGLVPAPNADDTRRWFATSALQIDAPEGGGEVVGAFAFTNPNAEPIEWRDYGASCACAKCTIVVGDRTYEMKPKPRELVELVERDGKSQRVPVELVTVGPGEHGELRVHVAVPRGTAHKSVSVDVHMSDPKTPMARVHVDVKGTEPVLVSPQAIELGSVQPGVAREFTATITSPQQARFSILGGELPPGVTATWTRNDAGVSTIWVVRGSFTAKDTRAQGGVLKFRTDLPGAPLVNLPLRVKVEVLVEVSPGFVTMGTIHLGTKAVGSIRFTPNDGRDLKVTALRLEGVNVAVGLVTLHQRMDGKVLVVDIEVDEKAPRGLVRGDVVVELDHPDAPSTRVKFNGFVR